MISCLHSRKNNLSFGSPNLALYSSTFGPSAVSISPKKIIPVNGRPSACHSIYRCLIYICSYRTHLPLLYRTDSVKKFPFRLYSALISVLCTFMILCGCHGTNCLPSTKERTDTSRPVINSSMTIVFPALPNFLSSMNLFHAGFCLFQSVADQNAFSKCKSICLRYDREFCLCM